MNSLTTPVFSKKMPLSPMTMAAEGRNMVRTAAITLLLVAAVIVVYHLTRGNRNQPAPATATITPGTTPPPSDPAPSNPSPDVTNLLSPGPLPSPPEETQEPTKPALDAYQVIRGAEFVPERQNRADRFRMKVIDNEFIFQLYNVEGLSRDSSDSARIQIQTGYFHIEPTALLNAGEEAYEYVKNLLQDRQFTIFTLWEPAGGQGAYYAYVLVNHKPGTRNFLSELLIARGFAMPSGRTQTVPFGGLTETGFRDRLREFETMAREKKLGAWKSASLRPAGE